MKRISFRRFLAMVLVFTMVLTTFSVCMPIRADAATTKYTITFVKNDGSAPYSNSYIKGAYLPAISKTGYKFDGWYTAASGGSKVTTVSKTQTVFAHWTKNSYSITFNRNDGSGTYKTTYSYGAYLPTISRTGYTFDGWYTAVSGGSRVNTVSGAQTVYAHWTPAKYTITFNKNDGSATYSNSYEYGASLPSASRTGYSFDGWFTEGSGGTKVTTVSKDQTVFAQWTKKSYTITFDRRDGSKTYTGTYKYADSLPAITRTGYTFDGWYTAASGGSKVTSVSKAQTVYAHWSKAKYSITFNRCDGSMTYSNTYEYGASLPGESRTGYTFDGWYTAASGGSKVTTVSKAQTVFAHWTPNTYTIKFERNDGTGSFTQELKHDEKMPVLTRTGYVFDGWYTALSGGSKVTTASESRTVYAHWSKEKYTITFNMCDGSAPFSGQYPYKSAIPTVSRTGYEFDGWYTAASGGSRVTSATKTQTVFAHWSVQRINVTFDRCDGSAPYTVTRNYGDYIGDGIRTGYTFDGWYTAAAGGTRVYQVKEKQTLYAHWTAKKVNITFDLNSSNPNGLFVGHYPVAGEEFAEKSTKTEFGADISFPSKDPVRDGYSFAGWWNKPEGGKKYTADTKVDSEKDFTLYAHWELLSPGPTDAWANVSSLTNTGISEDMFTYPGFYYNPGSLTNGSVGYWIYTDSTNYGVKTTDYLIWQYQVSGADTNASDVNRLDLKLQIIASSGTETRMIPVSGTDMLSVSLDDGNVDLFSRVISQRDYQVGASGSGKQFVTTTKGLANSAKSVLKDVVLASDPGAYVMANTVISAVNSFKSFLEVADVSTTPNGQTYYKTFITSYMANDLCRELSLSLGSNDSLVARNDMLCMTVEMNRPDEVDIAWDNTSRSATVSCSFAIESDKMETKTVNLTRNVVYK